MHISSFFPPSRCIIIYLDHLSKEVSYGTSRNEFKMLLKENIFKKLLSDYKNTNQRQLSTNQFLSFSSSIGKEKNNSLRIREKKRYITNSH